MLALFENPKASQPYLKIDLYKLKKTNLEDPISRADLFKMYTLFSEDSMDNCNIKSSTPLGFFYDNLEWALIITVELHIIYKHTNFIQRPVD